MILSVVLFGSYRYGRAGLPRSCRSSSSSYPIVDGAGRARTGREVAENAVWPHFVREPRTFLFLAVAIIGTTITPYMQLYQAAAVADRGIGPGRVPDGADRRRSSGSIFAGLIFMSILIATAATIGGSGPLTSAAEAAKALEPVAGAGAETLFAIGLLGASLLAAAVVPLSTAYGRRRGGRGRAVGVPAVPRGAAVPRSLHRAGRHRRRGRARSRGTSSTC